MESLIEDRDAYLDEVQRTNENEARIMADLLATREERDKLRAELDRLRSAPVAVVIPERATPVTHFIKIQDPHYTEQAEGRKTFELRQEDTRYFCVGDVIVLHRFPCDEAPPLRRRVTHLLRGPAMGLAEGWVILSTVPVGDMEELP